MAARRLDRSGRVAAVEKDRAVPDLLPGRRADPLGDHRASRRHRHALEQARARASCSSGASSSGAGAGAGRFRRRAISSSPQAHSSSSSCGPTGSGRRERWPAPAAAIRRLDRLRGVDRSGDGRRRGRRFRPERRSPSTVLAVRASKVGATGTAATAGPGRCRWRPPRRGSDPRARD